MKIPRRKTLIYIFVFMVIYLSGSVTASINSNSVLYKFILCSTLLLGVLLSYKGMTSFFLAKKNYSIVIVVSLIYIVVEFLISRETASLFGTRIAWFLILLAFLIRINKYDYDVFTVLFNVILFIEIYTFAFYFLIHIVGINLPHTVLDSDASVTWSLKYYNYFNVFFENVVASLRTTGFRIVRFSGLFWEPGANQIFINYGVFYLLFYKKKIEWKPFVFLSICVFFTLSTTGIATYLILVMLRAFYKIKTSKIARVLMLVPIVGLIILVFSQMIEFKTGFGGTGVQSYLDRTSDILVGFQVFLRHFVLGTGFNNSLEFTMLQGLGRGNSNGVITILYTMGAVGSFLLALPFVINTVRIKDSKEKNVRLAFCLWFLISNAAEPIYVTPLFWLIYANEILMMINGKKCETYNKIVVNSNNYFIRKQF